MKKLLKNTFVPHRDNHHKPYLFKGGVVVVIAAIALLAFFGGIMQKVQLYTSDTLAAVYSKALIALTNENREDASLTSLKVNPLLEEAARLKAEHMALYGYFSHYGPDGTAPWDWLEQAGYNYLYAGENLAVNFTDSRQVDRAWMNSPLHRANIMNEDFTEIGIATAPGIYKGKETVFIVQMFGTPQKTMPASAASPNITAEAETKHSPVATITHKIEAGSSSESFMAVKGVYDVASPIMGEDVVTNPRQTIMIIFALLFVIVSIGMMGIMFSEFHKHHIRHAVIALSLLILIVLLAYAYHLFIVQPVLIN